MAVLEFQKMPQPAGGGWAGGAGGESRSVLESVHESEEGDLILNWGIIIVLGTAESRDTTEEGYRIREQWREGVEGESMVSGWRNRMQFICHECPHPSVYPAAEGLT